MPKIIINPKLKKKDGDKSMYARKRNPRAMPDIHLIIIIPLQTVYLL